MSLISSHIICGLFGSISSKYINFSFNNQILLECNIAIQSMKLHYHENHNQHDSKWQQPKMRTIQTTPNSGFLKPTQTKAASKHPKSKLSQTHINLSFLKPTQIQAGSSQHKPTLAETTPNPKLSLKQPQPQAILNHLKPTLSQATPNPSCFKPPQTQPVSNQYKPKLYQTNINSSRP